MTSRLSKGRLQMVAKSAGPSRSRRLAQALRGMRLMGSTPIDIAWSFSAPVAHTPYLTKRTQHNAQQP